MGNKMSKLMTGILITVFIIVVGLIFYFSKVYDVQREQRMFFTRIAIYLILGIPIFLYRFRIVGGNNKEKKEFTKKEKINLYFVVGIFLSIGLIGLALFSRSEELGIFFLTINIIIQIVVVWYMISVYKVLEIVEKDKKYKNLFILMVFLTGGSSFLTLTAYMQNH